MSTPGATAVFGGTFNPFHCGHLGSARDLFSVLPLRELRFVPAAQPPHRDAPGVSAEHRARMVELAIADDARPRCDRRELERAGPSYTVDTLQSLRDELGAEASLMLVVGCDAVLDLPRWRHWERLLDLAHIVVLARPGWEFPVDGTVHDLLQDRSATAQELGSIPAGRTRVQELTPRDVSATQIRALLQSGDEVSRLVPHPVIEYIREHGLYTGATGPTQE